MTTTSSKYILGIYKSRKNITDILEAQQYDVSEYNSFSINDVDAMFSNNQLDMLMTKHVNNDTGTKIYIKYHLTTKQIKKQVLDDVIEDLFSIDNILDKSDTLIIVTEDEPNDTIISHVKYLYDATGIFVVIHSIKRLQFNLFDHKLVPITTILTPVEVDELKVIYNIIDLSQLPEISRFDPLALALCLRPGQVCKHNRSSVSTMTSVYYRVCVSK